MISCPKEIIQKISLILQKSATGFVFQTLNPAVIFAYTICHLSDAFYIETPQEYFIIID